MLRLIVSGKKKGFPNNLQAFPTNLQTFHNNLQVLCSHTLGRIPWCFAQEK